MAGLHDAALDPLPMELARVDTVHYRFTLFVSGASALSARAVAALRAFCDTQVPGRYELAVVDVYQEPDRVHQARVLAVPTLLREAPLPARRLVGDLSDAGRLYQLLVRPPPRVSPRGAELAG